MEPDITNAWADPAPAVAALQIGPDDDVLRLYGVGDEALSLLIAGARSVTLVEPDLPRRACLGLLLAGARALPLQSTRALFGHDAAGRRLWFYHFVREGLPSELWGWWDAHEALIRAGIQASGRFERHLDRFARLCRGGLAPDINRRFEPLEPGARALVNRRPWCSPSWRAAFQVAFSRPALRRQGLLPGAAPSDERGGRALFTALDRQLRVPERTPGLFARRLLLGDWGEGADGPLHLSPEGYRRLVPALDRLQLRSELPLQFLQACTPGIYSALDLADLPSRASPSERQALWRAALRVARPGARFVWREGPEPVALPTEATARLLIDQQLEAELQKADRGFFSGPLRLARLKD